MEKCGSKNVAKRMVFAASKETKKEKMEDIEGDSYTYHLVKKMKQENKDTVGKKFIWDDDSVLAFHEEDKKNAWKQHYES